MTPHPELPTIARVRRLWRPTVYRVFLPDLPHASFPKDGRVDIRAALGVTPLHYRQFDHAQDVIDWATLHLPNQAIDMQLQ